MTIDEVPLPPDPGDDDTPPPPTRRPPRRHGRVPPHNLQAEQALLGALLLMHERAIDTVSTIPNPDDYYDPRHKLLASAINAVAETANPVDVVTVCEHLRAHDTLQDAGDIEYIAGLQDATPSVSGAESYATAVRETATLRRIITASTRITESAFGATSALAAIDEANNMLRALAESPLVLAASGLDVADFEQLLAAGLQPPAPDLLLRRDGAGLLYLGKIHAFQAEPSSGKTFLALHAVKEVLDRGGAAVFVDYEDSPHSVYGRALSIGCEADALRTRFAYVSHAGPLGASELAQLDHVIDNLNPDLVVVDGVAEAMTREGLSEDSAEDFYVWANRLPRRIARTGAAVVIIDHIVKDKDNQGRYARGTGAKLAFIDGATFNVRVVSPFSRRRAGYVRLTVAKDKPGGVGHIGEHVAHFHLEPHADGERVITTLNTPPNDQPADTHTGDTVDWQPTHTMERIMRALQDGPLTATALRATIAAKPRITSKAIETLIASGHISETRDGRRKVLTAAKPYTAPDTPTHQPEPEPHPADQLTIDTTPLTDHELTELIGPPPWETMPDEFDDHF